MSRAAGTYAIFETSQGDIVIRLLEKEAPKTVENFIGLAEGTKEFTNEKTGQEGKAEFLRWADVSSGDSAIHDSRRMSGGYGTRWTGL